MSDEQRDEQVAAAPEDAVAVAIDSARKNIHTSMPGIIVDYDPDKKTCSVQPVIQHIWADTGPQNLPLCVDCPVVFPSGGGWVLSFPIKPGDEAVIFFSERCIDSWYVDGRIAPPADYRMHDLSDGYVLVGLDNLTKVPAGLRTDAVELRSYDGTKRITMADDGTITQSNGAASITLGADGKITLVAPGGVEFQAPNVHGTGTANFDQDVTGQGTSLHTHRHQVVGVQAGSATIATQPPT